MTKELIEKFRVGDSLTDSEVKELYDYYKRLQQDTYLLGERYNLMWVDMYQSQVRLQGYMRSRGIFVDNPF